MILAVDTETTGRDFFHGCKPFMVTACDGESNYYWIGEVNPYDRSDIKWSEDDLIEIQEYLDKADTLVFHNAKFDVRALHTIGINAHKWDKIEDTMIASHVCCSGERHGLKQLAFKYLGYYNNEQQKLEHAVQIAREQYKEYDLARKGHPTMPGEGTGKPRWWAMDYWLCIDECLKYGIDDVEMTWLLWKMYKSVIQRMNMEEVYQSRKELLQITYEMQSHGMYAYVDNIKQQIKQFEALRKILTDRIHKECRLGNTFDFNRPGDVHHLLFNVLELPVLERSEKTDKPKISKDVIERYKQAYPSLAPLQHFTDFKRCGTKAGYLSSYLKWTDDNNKVHSDLLITGTRETRQASRNPNTQNIDKELSGIFGPPPGKVWLIYDLVNIELRIWAYEVQNPEMVDIFESGKSYHMEIAKILYPELCQECKEEGTTFKTKHASLYQWIKNGNFSIIYGAGERKANRTYNVQGVNAYRKIINRFPEVPIFTQSKIKEVFDNELKYGYPFVTCKGGYRLDVNPKEVYTKACNYYCQGSAGYTIGLSMQEVHKNPTYTKTSAAIVNQVHDSLYIEIPVCHNTQETRASFQRSIEKGGERLLPTCAAELEKILYHPGEGPDAG